jgi:hypothetical protein
MPTVEWDVQATEFANCNCNYGCPCQFNALPTHGDCRAVIGYRIEQGHFADIRLDGLRAAALYSWPGPIHEGNGTMQLVIDERADARQRDALAKIMSGDETEEMATAWWVFAAMSPNKLPPLYGPIRFDVDVESRRAHLSVPGVVETSGEPIRNPVTGADHRVQIGMPHGFEFRLAEMGSGTTRSTTEIALDLKGTHGHFARIHFSNKGVMA